MRPELASPDFCRDPLQDAASQPTAARHTHCPLTSKRDQQAKGLLAAGSRCVI